MALTKGWMRTILLGDIGNRLDIADTEEDIRLLRHRHQEKAEQLDENAAAIRKLREAIARQTLLFRH